ncbi:MAG: hypothetical protein KC912_10485 [Proteobacteria bacterium]|nr:hypothetical protein [Pseudomonadota bacterium]
MPFAQWIQLIGHTRMPWRNAAFTLIEVCRNAGASVLDGGRMSNLAVRLTLEVDAEDLSRLLPALRDAGVVLQNPKIPEGDGPWRGTLMVSLVHDEAEVRDVKPAVPG